MCIVTIVPRGTVECDTIGKQLNSTYIIWGLEIPSDNNRLVAF